MLHAVATIERQSGVRMAKLVVGRQQISLAVKILGRLSWLDAFLRKKVCFQMIFRQAKSQWVMETCTTGQTYLAVIPPSDEMDLDKEYLLPRRWCRKKLERKVARMLS